MALYDDGSMPRPGDPLPPPDRVVGPVGVPVEAEPSKRRRRHKKKSSPARSAIEWALVIAGALLVAFLIRTFLLAAFYIPSASMVATLEEGDRVLVNKLSYRLHDVNRGDIVVFERPPSEPDTGIEDYIKRVIGVPGDVIDIKDCHVVRNGEVLNESYVADGACTSPQDEALPYTVPPGEVWVMGDNRQVSIDSRTFGSIRESTIVGRAFLRIWPLSHFGFL